VNSVVAYNLILAGTGLPIVGAVTYFVSRMLVDLDAKRHAEAIAALEARKQAAKRPVTRPTYSPRAADSSHRKALSR
jgi:hypothetical protein